MPSVLGNTPLDANVMLAPPYDAEVKYLKGKAQSGTYIDTLIAPNGETEYEIAMRFTGGTISGNVFGARDVSSGLPVFGIITHRNVDLSINRLSSSNWNTQFAAEMFSDAVYSFKDGVAKYNDSSTGTLSGTTQLTNTAYIFGFNNAGTPTGDLEINVYWCKIWQSGVLVRDYIPVRKNGIGYLYDRVSGQLFGNAGSGDPFVIGQDIDVHNALANANANFDNIKHWLTDSTFTFKPTITFASGWSASSDIQIRLVNGRIGAITGDIKCTSALTAGSAYTPFSAVSYPSGISLYQGCRLGANQRLFIYYNNASTSIVPENGISANTTIYLRGLIPMTVYPDTAPSYVKYIAPLF